MKKIIFLFVGVGCVQPNQLVGTTACKEGQTVKDSHCVDVLANNSNPTDANSDTNSNNTTTDNSNTDATIPPGCNPALCETGFLCGANGCEPGPGYCAVDMDCNFGERCDANVCISRAGDVIATCGANSDCGPLMTCQAGICIGCLDDLQCSGGKCVLGTCIIADLGPAGNCINMTCAQGERCDLTTGTCATICSSDTDCGSDESCAPVLQKCIAKYGCSDVSQCQVPQQCMVGLCVGCTSDPECKASERCLLGTCFPRLDQSQCTNVQCSASELCDSHDGSCYPANGTCQDASDCRPGHHCNFLHLCSGCSVDGDCRTAQRCLLGTCVPVQN